MKARLTLAVAVILAGTFGSCQQAFVDKEARSGGNSLSPSLEPVSVGPGDVPSFSGTPASATTAPLLWAQVSNFAFLAFNKNTAVHLSNIHRANATVPATDSGETVTPASGLDGYTPLYPEAFEQRSYYITHDAGPLAIGSPPTTIGTITGTDQGYQEVSNEYLQFDKTAGISKLFRKAMHRYENGSRDMKFTYAQGAFTVTGREIESRKNEWYRDSYETPVPGASYYIYNGITEVSAGWVFSVTGSVDNGSGGTETVGAKFVMKISGSKSYAYGNDKDPTAPESPYAGINRFISDYNVTAYDNSGKVIYTGTQPNPESPYKASTDAYPQTSPLPSPTSPTATPGPTPTPKP